MSYYNQQQPPVGVPPPQGYPPGGYPKAEYLPTGYPPQGYPPQSYPPQYGYAQPPPPQQQQTGCLEGWYSLLPLYLSLSLRMYVKVAEQSCGLSMLKLRRSCSSRSILMYTCFTNMFRATCFSFPFR